MTPAQLKALRVELQLGPTRLAELTGVGEATVVRWEAGLAAIPAPAGRLLASLRDRALLDRLSEEAFRERRQRAQGGATDPDAARERALRELIDPILTLAETGGPEGPPAAAALLRVALQFGRRAGLEVEDLRPVLDGLQPAGEPPGDEGDASGEGEAHRPSK